jgi:hypothetical protein
MALETGTYISDLVPTNPDPADSETYGANHLQLIKATLKNTFAAITGAVTVTQAELNTIKGAASSGATIQVVTQPTSDNSTNAASTAYVNQKAFQAALPAQGGSAGGVLTTNGSAASWVANPSGLNGQVLTNNAGNVAWAPPANPDFLLMAQGVV